MKEYENKKEISIKELIEILSNLDQTSIVLNGKEKNIRIYPGKENKKGEKSIVIIC